ncbi:glycoside hydrolase family 31 protein [Dyella acidiphila]|uniref:Glycoside hydrolase family 31 protein n=1 Tax=Dyella acidiphila TaxID=2775866 RepID=A0ABR9G9T1_9GAMM|nr:TIM-barrel domain-containing protein [Dyella acidiphila]MBE1160811.1 glycoside hydrolase family 31 protein [Dyella acidiphila]
MKGSKPGFKFVIGWLLLVWLASPCYADSTITASQNGNGIALAGSNVSIHLQLIAPNVLQVQVLQNGAAALPKSLVMDPHATPAAITATLQDGADALTMSSDRIDVRWDKHASQLAISDKQGHVLLRQDDLAALAQGRIVLSHAADDPLYGIHGYYAAEPSDPKLLRSGVEVAKAGEQGFAGAPFVWSTRGYGVLVDAMPARFELQGARLSIDGYPGNSIDYYLIVGTPADIFAAVSTLSGPAPLYPKWAMGFTNSQWGIDEHELLDIIDGYRQRQIPIDNVTLDFDWKAWGQDNYGEFRWNTDKFPDGPSGKLKAELDQRGMHLSGIMKPRIHVDTVQGRYATAHDLWYADKPAIADYFSHKLVRDIDFNKPAARAWFFNDTLQHTFDTGLIGWWNDEGDDTGDDRQFMNMQRALYDGQRAHSPLRVWSINRNFYLGAQRYAYGLWSGDIDTGFQSMADQRERMLSAIDLGEWKWGMDGGGFKGHPSDENYARWVEFGAFTPVFRVHGSLNEKRQPWRYGSVAEAAATRAIRLRYHFIPYIYAYERKLHDQGVGLVRPLAFAYPDDPNVRNDVDAWMFGDALLVAPVMQQGQTVKRIYLPAGRWTDYTTGVVYQGGQVIDYPLDDVSWQDIPLFVREGAIIPTAPAMQYVGEKPLTVLDVDAFPGPSPTSFDYYDDDGSTYAYEQGAFYRQRLSVANTGEQATFELGAPQGSYQPTLRYYLIKLHGVLAAQVSALSGKHAASLDALRAQDQAGWATGEDLYGNVTYLKLPAAHAIHVALQPASQSRQAALAQRFAGNAQALVHQAGVAQPTPAQLQQLQMALDGPGVPLPIRPSWNQALPNIARVIMYLSCYPAWDAWNHLHAYQTPGVGSSTYYLSAMNATRYHDRHQCLSVRGIHSVQQASPDSFSFRVLFVADDSQESADRTFGMVRQPDGSWLFARGGF